MPSPKQEQQPWLESSCSNNDLDECSAKKGHTSFAASMLLQTKVEPNTYSIALCNLQNRLLEFDESTTFQ